MIKQFAGALSAQTEDTRNYGLEVGQQISDDLPASIAFEIHLADVSSCAEVGFLAGVALDWQSHLVHGDSAEVKVVEASCLDASGVLYFLLLRNLLCLLERVVEGDCERRSHFVRMTGSCFTFHNVAADSDLKWTR